MPYLLSLERLVINNAELRLVRRAFEWWYERFERDQIERLERVVLRGLRSSDGGTGEGVLASLPRSVEHLSISLDCSDAAIGRVVAPMYADFATPSVLPNLRTFIFELRNATFELDFPPRPGVQIVVRRC